MNFPSLLPLNKLGEADRVNVRPRESGDVLSFFGFELPEGFADPVDSAEPRLFCSDIDEGACRKLFTSVTVLRPSLGGWGNAAMLIDRRTSFWGDPDPESCSGLIEDARIVSTSGVEFV